MRSAGPSGRFGSVRAGLFLTLGLCFLLGLLLVGAPRAAEEGQTLRVDRITISGNYLVFRSDILRRLGLERGATIRERAFRRRVDRVNEWGGFGTMSVEISRLEGGEVALRLRLQERVRVERVRFVGNRSINDRRLEGLVGFGPGRVINPDDARAGERTIREAYRRRERPLASVTASARFPGDEPAAIIRFGIVEGPRAFVKRIEVHGNSAFSDGRIRGTMRTSKRGWLTFLWPGKFDIDRFREDVRRVADRYYQEGYLDSSTAGYWTYTGNFSGVVPHVVVYEGERYEVRNIVFAGNKIFTSGELLEAIPLEEGAVFRPRVLDRSKNVISDMYGQQGHVDVGAPGTNTLQDRLVFNPEGAEGVLDVRIEIDEGVPIFVRRVRVEGLTRTDEIVVLRNLTFKPGDRADTEEFQVSERRLLDTGYFDRQSPNPVDITLEEPAPEPGEEEAEAVPGVPVPSERAMRDAVVRVKEGTTGNLMLGAGVSSQAGLLGQISLRERNFDIGNPPTSWEDFWKGNAFRGAGQELNIRFSLGTERSTFLISFADPSVNNTGTSFSSRIYRHVVAWDEFDLSRTGLAVGLGDRMGRLVKRGIEVGFESAAVTDLDDGASPEIRRDDDTYNKPFVGVSISRDTRDSTVLPSEGYLARVEAEVGFMDIETVKVVGDLAKYWPIVELENGGKHILQVRGRAGLIDSWSGDRIPVFERFYAGGMDSLRGFEPWGVSPVEPVNDEQVGGESMLIGSVEYSLPAITDDLRLAAFVDAGYVKEDVQDIFTGWDEVRLTTGVGVRWNIPAMGGLPITIDLAVPLVREEDDETRNLHFTLGAGTSF